jgi:hypothetical protein
LEKRNERSARKLIPADLTINDEPNKTVKNITNAEQGLKVQIQQNSTRSLDLKRPSS